MFTRCLPNVYPEQPLVAQGVAGVRGGRFGAVLDLYEKNEEKGQGQLLQEEEEVMFCLDFEGRFYLNHQLVDLEEME